MKNENLRMIKTISYSITALIVLVIGFCAYIKSSTAKEGEVAPSIEATLLNGTHFRLEDLRGEYVILNFWGSWCRPCRAENLDLVQFYKKYKHKVKIVTYAFEKNTNNGELASNRDGFSWEHQIIEQSNLVLLSKTARDYGVFSIPTIFLISPEGHILSQNSLATIELFFSQL